MNPPARSHAALVAGVLAPALAVALIGAGCTAQQDPAAAPPAQTPPSAPAPTVTTPETPASTPPRTTAPPAPRPVSLQALMRREHHGRGLRIVDTVGHYGSYTRHEVRYRSGDLLISGILNVPDGRGPFPALVLNHGYIEPSDYVTGQGLSREQDYLARAGYVVLHTDYRGHAASDTTTRVDMESRLGYTEDVLNAVLALRRKPYVDAARVGLLGRSMGGGVTYNALVAQPGLVDAAVVYAPVSSLFLDNFRRWTVSSRPGVAARWYRRFGHPARAPRAYRDLSARTFFDRVTEPVLIHHGTADESCPLRWSRQTLRALHRDGVRARLRVYPGEPHAFIADWERSMRRTVRFLRSHLRG